MNNSYLALAIAALVIVGGGYIFLTSSGSNEGGEIAMEENMDMTASAAGTFASLVASGQSLECTFQHDDGTNVTSGTVYLTGGAEQIRGTFTLQQGDEESVEAYLVRTGGYNYVWGSFYPQGIKSQVTPGNEGKLFDEESGAIDENTTFNCEPWLADASTFGVPTDVEFMDVSMPMEEIGDLMEDIQAQ
jgi:hypothetical protein